jgi:hypothetical protein
MATGRKTVVVGQVIDPVVWGNPLWDQSVQQFASAADRSAQFPTPKNGAVTFLEDVQRLELRANGVWAPVTPAPVPPYATTVVDMAARTGVAGQALKSPAAVVDLTAGYWRVQGGAMLEVSAGTADAFALTLFNTATNTEVPNSRGSGAYLAVGFMTNVLTRPTYVSVPIGQVVQAQVVGVPQGVASVLTMYPGAGGPSAWIEAYRITSTPLTATAKPGEDEDEPE